jgi:hypothetical protein
MLTTDGQQEHRQINDTPLTLMRLSHSSGKIYTDKDNIMVLPLVGIAVATAARLAAKKLAQEAVKKTAKSATSRARSNSAAAAKAVAPKNPPITASRIKMAKTVNARKKFDAANQKRILDNQVKKSVEVLPRKTAPKTDLSNRGAKLTKSQRSERAQDYQFDKSLGKYYSNQDRIAGTHPSELARGSRGEGVKSARKTAAIKKEAKTVVKINSQRNLKAK